MSDTDKAKTAQEENDSKRKTGEQKKKTITDKLRKKLEKLKKEDPNIYPVF